VRLFAAVYPPAGELERLARAVTLPYDLRPVPQDQWHLTTAFYGEVPDARVEALLARLERVATSTSPLRLSLVGAGSFPARPARARQVWAGVDGDVDALSRLAERCAAAGRREGLRSESRRYRPHLTLGRARRTTADATALVAALSAYRGTPWTASELTVVRSTLGNAVVHETLATFGLSGAVSG
jgi:RNA 2',3'-cyclic 3'-phosphodiesterase